MIRFPQSFKIEKGELEFDTQNPFDNIVSINNVDYIPYPLDFKNPRSVGANSYVLKLINAQHYDDSYPEVPDLVIKVCKFWYYSKKEHKRSQRFKNEIDALISCKENNLSNITQISHHGFVQIYQGDRPSTFRFYTMDYADSSMASFLEENILTLFQKLDLCLELCESLRQLRSIGYYHRDIKPDNILFINRTWIISDLGIAEHQDTDASLDVINEWVGPKGWMSPESMNKFLAGATHYASLFDCKIDHQSDIFQLGKIFWFILQGNSPEGAIRRPDFQLTSDSIYQIIRTMLNHSKKRRYHHIEQVIEDLKRVYIKMDSSGNEFFIAN